MGEKRNRGNEKKTKGVGGSGLELIRQLTEHCRENFITELKLGEIELKFHARSFPERKQPIDLSEEKGDNIKKPIGALKNNDEVLYHSV